MAEEAKKTTEGDPAAATAEKKPENADTKTVGEIQEEVQTNTSKETVGLDKYLSEKRERKAAETELARLKDEIANGATKAETTASIDAIAEKYPEVSKEFLQDIAKVFQAQAKKDIEDGIASVKKPLEDKEKQGKIDEAFTKHFNIAMENMPEFKGIVNADVIKSLSLLPKNSNKTFSQLIEETYGGALTGKRTIETTVPGGGKDTEPLDFEKAQKDAAYFDIVMANPRLKAEYNDRMLKAGW